MSAIQFVGLDVHKKRIVVAAAAECEQSAMVVGTAANEVGAVLKLLDRIGPRSSLRCAYEAGPTGYGLQRGLAAKGIECCVIAPSLVPKKPGDRIKTDRRDAVSLAQNLRANQLTTILVPDPETEAIRDLERARRDASRALLAAKQQLGAFLLRHGRQFTGKSCWTVAHFDWLRGQKFEHRAHEAVFADALHAVIVGQDRIAALDSELESIVPTWSRYPLVRALQVLRGVQLLTATTLVAEVVDFQRFASPRKLMAYVGMVPGENSSGESIRRGRITHAGNSAVRRVLTESAWAYLHPPRESRVLRLRAQGVAVGVKAIAWKAQQRLHQRLAALLARRKNVNKACVAVGRELLGFIWAIARERQLLAVTQTVAAK